MDPFIGTEAIASGALTRGQLRWNHVALHPDVYVPKDQRRSAWTDVRAALLWAGPEAIVAGRYAAELHGVHGIADREPIELIAPHSRRGRGVVVRSERIEDDEVECQGSVRMTTPARTALDLARRMPRDLAVRYLDQLAAATKIAYDDVVPLLDRYRGVRGIVQARSALLLMDGGSRSPEETRLRLILVDAGLPWPRTSIVVGEGMHSAVIAMGWDRAKVGVSIYDGGSHLGCAAVQHTQVLDVIQRSGWIDLQVADLRRTSSILYRVRSTLRERGCRG